AGTVVGRQPRTPAGRRLAQDLRRSLRVPDRRGEVRATMGAAGGPRVAVPRRAGSPAPRLALPRHQSTRVLSTATVQRLKAATGRLGSGPFGQPPPLDVGVDQAAIQAGRREVLYEERCCELRVVTPAYDRPGIA